MSPSLQKSPSSAGPTTVTTVEEVSLLDSILDAKEPPARKAGLPGQSVEAVPDSLLDSILEAPKAAPKKPPVTPLQRELITELRRLAQILGGKAQEKAAEKCQPFQADAEDYRIKLQALLLEESVKQGRPLQSLDKKPAPPAVQAPAAPAPVKRTSAGQVAPGALPVTPKQWGYIRHLRRQARRAGFKALADKGVANDRKEASNYIASMITALRNRYKASPSNGGQGGSICSVCWTPGCGIGPMVSR